MRVLVVDDDEEIRVFLRTMLTLDGWDAAVAASGAEALDRFPGYQPDLVVLDLMMPAMPGIEVARRLRDQGFSGPIVLFSGFLSDDLEAEVEALGLTPVSKPDHDALQRILRAFVTERESGHAV